MIDVFLFSFNAVMPIILLMGLGMLLKKLRFADDAFFKKANALVFHVFLPLLLFCNIYEIETLSDVSWGVIGYICVIVLLLAFIGAALAKLFIPNRLQKGPFIQCVFRSNCAIVGITLADALGGAPAVAFMAVATAATIPLFNTLAVIVLSYHSDADKKPSVRQTLLRTVKNPLIISVALGLLVIGLRALLPLKSDGTPVFLLSRDCAFLFSTLSTAAKAATPLALVVLGARFDFSAVKGMRRQIVLGTFMRIVFAPLLAIGCAVALHRTGLLSFTAVEYPSLVAIFGSPIAVSSAVMIGEIGGDDQYGAQLVVWTSVFSMFTIFLTVFCMRAFALI